MNSGDIIMSFLAAAVAVFCLHTAKTAQKRGRIRVGRGRGHYIQEKQRPERFQLAVRANYVLAILFFAGAAYFLIYGALK